MLPGEQLLTHFGGGPDCRESAGGGLSSMCREAEQSFCTIIVDCCCHDRKTWTKRTAGRELAHGLVPCVVRPTSFFMYNNCGLLLS